VTAGQQRESVGVRVRGVVGGRRQRDAGGQPTVMTDWYDQSVIPVDWSIVDQSTGHANLYDRLVPALVATVVGMKEQVNLSTS